MDRRIIILGAGRVGYYAAKALSDRGHDICVIERNTDRCEDIADAYFATVIRGDGTRPDILRQADPTTADVVVGLTPNPGANLGCCVLASRMNPDITTAIRVSTPEGADGYEEVVDATIFPERAGARATVNAITGETLRSVETLPGELEVVEIRVLEEAPVAGRRLGQVSLPRGSLVISDADGDRVPGSETVLEAGHSYLVAVEPAVADEVRHLFHG